MNKIKKKLILCLSVFYIAAVLYFIAVSVWSGFIRDEYNISNDSENIYSTAFIIILAIIIFLLIAIADFMRKTDKFILTKIVIIITAMSLLVLVKLIYNNVIYYSNIIQEKKEETLLSPITLDELESYVNTSVEE